MTIDKSKSVSVKSKKVIMRKEKKYKTIKTLKKTWILYLFILPTIIYLTIFNYVPLYGIQIAFKDYRSYLGILGSEWVGLEHFITFFNSYQCTTLIKNTIVLSLYSLIAGFPIPIILALLLNYVRNKKYKKFVQMTTYAPHFISTVVFCGMVLVFLNINGIINQILSLIGVGPVNFLGNPEYFRNIYVWSGVLKAMGWNSIIYIAALAGVNPSFHEAAIVDGASKLQRIWHIDIPAILPTAIILLILNLGNIMNVGFEKVLLLQNNVNLDFSEIISTYVYKVGIQGGQFSYSTAIGLFNNVINFCLVISANKISKVVTKVSIW